MAKTKADLLAKVIQLENAAGEMYEQKRVAEQKARDAERDVSKAERERDAERSNYEALLQENARLKGYIDRVREQENGRISPEKDDPLGQRYDMPAPRHSSGAVADSGFYYDTVARGIRERANV